MGRARNIKHGLWLNEELAELDIYARFLFPCLWCLADKQGRLEYRPRKIKAESFPYDDVDIPALLIQLHEKGFIQIYGYEGRAYIQVGNWEKHQNPHPKEKGSIIPYIGDERSTIATIGYNEENEKQLKFTAKPLPDHERQRSTSDSNPSDSLIPDSIPSSSLPDEAEAKPEKMTRKEFVSLYHATFNQMMSGGLNDECTKICDRYLPDKIRDAFTIAAANHATTLNYVKAVLEDKQHGRSTDTGSAAHPRTEKGKPAGPVIDGTPKPAGYYAGDFPDRSDEW